MATLFFHNHEIQIYRQRRVSNTNRHTMSATGTVNPADITPAEPQRSQYENQAVGKLYIGYVDVNLDIKVNDEVVIRDTTGLNGKRFQVNGVSHWEGFGVVDCKELSLVAKD